jgi:hypothetical protein
LQEFNVEIRDKKGSENVVANHLSRINREEDGNEPIEYKMRDDHLYQIIDKNSWMNDIIRAIRRMPLDHLNKNAKQRVIAESRKYYWDAPYLFRHRADGVLRRCVPREEILRKCHSSEYGGYYGHFRTQAKVWASGFYWSEMHEDSKRFVATC